MTIALDEPNWTAVLRRLLRGFNKIEVWNESDHLHHVILVESGSSGQDVSLNKEGFMLADRTRKSEKTGPVYKGPDKGETSPEVSSPRAGSPPPTESQGMGGGSPPPDDYVYPENAGPDVSGAIEDGSPPPDDYKYPENAGPPVSSEEGPRTKP